VLARRTTVTQPAFDFAAKSGRTVHVWDEDFGGAWLRIRAGLEPPPGIEFQEIRYGTDRFRVSFRVVPSRVVVMLRRWPRPKLVAVGNDSPGP
jgi:hypothetical protein